MYFNSATHNLVGKQAVANEQYTILNTHYQALASVPYLIFETTMFIALIWRYMHSPERDYAGGNLLLYAIFHNAAVYFLVRLIIVLTSVLVLIRIDYEVHLGGRGHHPCDELCRSTHHTRKLYRVSTMAAPKLTHAKSFLI
jgi:hypothetical protein